MEKGALVILDKWLMKSKKQLEDGLFRMEELIGGAADE